MPAERRSRRGRLRKSRRPRVGLDSSFVVIEPYCELPTSNSQLPTANCQLSTANCQLLLTANCRLQTEVFHQRVPQIAVRVLFGHDGDADAELLRGFRGHRTAGGYDGRVQEIRRLLLAED